MHDKDSILTIFTRIFKGVYFFQIYFKNGNKNFFLFYITFKTVTVPYFQKCMQAKQYFFFNALEGMYAKRLVKIAL